MKRKNRSSEKITKGTSQAVLLSVLIHVGLFLLEGSLVVTDERGMIIDYGASHKWLIGILGNLRQLPLGKHFDKTGIRVGSTRPKAIHY